MREDATATPSSSRAARGVSALVGGARRAIALLCRRRRSGRGAALASMSAAALCDSAPTAESAAWLPPPAAWLQQQVGDAFNALHEQASALFMTAGGPSHAFATANSSVPCIDTSNTLPAALPVSTGAPHALVAIGHRHWGGPAVSGLLKVKIYDFAVYAEVKEARAALADAFAAAALAPQQQQQQRRRRQDAEGAAGSGAGANFLDIQAAPGDAPSGTAAEAASGWQLPLLPALPQLALPPVASWWATGSSQGGSEVGASESTSDSAAASSGAIATDGAPQRRRLLRIRLRRRRSHSGDASLLSSGAPADGDLTAAGAAGGGAAAALPDVLKSRRDCGVSLLLRAARDIPLTALREEYEKVLRRRLARVGGDPSDPSLPQLLDCFSDPRRLPPDAVAGSGTAVKRGASIIFRRRGPVVEALVGDRQLGSVTSTHLGEALFDLYLGSQPVSAPAKAGAADTLARILEAAPSEAGRGAGAAAAAAGDGPSSSGGGSSLAADAPLPVYYSPKSSERLRCTGDGSDARACVIEL